MDGLPPHELAWSLTLQGLSPGTTYSRSEEREHRCACLLGGGTKVPPKRQQTPSFRRLAKPERFRQALNSLSNLLLLNAACCFYCWVSWFICSFIANCFWFGFFFSFGGFLFRAQFYQNFCVLMLNLVQCSECNFVAEWWDTDFQNK